MKRLVAMAGQRCQPSWVIEESERQCARRLLGCSMSYQWIARLTPCSGSDEIRAVHLMPANLTVVAHHSCVRTMVKLHKPPPNNKISESGGGARRYCYAKNSQQHNNFFSLISAFNHFQPLAYLLREIFYGNHPCRYMFLRTWLAGAIWPTQASGKRKCLGSAAFQNLFLIRLAAKARARLLSGIAGVSVSYGHGAAFGWVCCWVGQLCLEYYDRIVNESRKLA